MPYERIVRIKVTAAKYKTNLLKSPKLPSMAFNKIINEKIKVILLKFAEKNCFMAKPPFIEFLNIVLHSSYNVD